MANLFTGSISALNGTAEASPLDNFGTVGIIVSGTWSGTLTFKAALSASAPFVTILAQDLTTNLLKTSITSNGQFLISVSGLYAVRLEMTSYTSGTADVVIQANAAIFLQRSLATLAGATDGTNIGNAADRLKVDAAVTSLSGGSLLTISNKLRYNDMNASTGGVARGTLIIDAAAATTVYSYSGSGTILGFLLNLEASSSSSHVWQINFLVDGEEIFGTGGLVSTDLISQTIYDFNTAGAREPTALGVEMTGTVIYFSTSAFFPLKYDASVVVKIKKVSGGSRAFNAGLMILSKVT